MSKLRYPNLQAEISVMEETLIYESVTDESEIKYISLEDIPRNFSDAAPSYVIQSWMRSGNTTAFLHLWEHRHNDSYNVGGYEELRAKLKTGTFTMTHLISKVIIGVHRKRQIIIIFEVQRIGFKKESDVLAHSFWNV